MNKSVKIGIIATILLTLFAGLTGFFEFAFLYHITIKMFYLNSTFMMLGIGLSLTSVFVETRRKVWFYGPILIIIIGTLIGLVIISHTSPLQITGPGVNVFDLKSFWDSFSRILFGNLTATFAAFLTSPLIITPYILLSIFTSDLYLAPAVISFYGFKGVILIIGWLNTYPELFAVYWALIASIKISLKSFKAFITIRKNGLKNTLKTIKSAMMHELRHTMPKVVILLIIAALLETLWDPFWVNYWLQHIVN